MNIDPNMRNSLQSYSTYLRTTLYQIFEAQGCHLYQNQYWQPARHRPQIWSHRVRFSLARKKRQLTCHSMPTFMIFRNSTVIATIRGADPRQLTQAVENAVRNAGPAKPAYSSVGRTLGGTAPANGTSMRRPLNVQGFMQAIINFVGLYLVSLFSVSESIGDLRAWLMGIVGCIHCSRKESVQYSSSRVAETEHNESSKEDRCCNCCWQETGDNLWFLKWLKEGCLNWAFRWW